MSPRTPTLPPTENNYVTTTDDERRADVMAPSREEQRLVEELWKSSARTYGEERRRKNCVEWIEHHQHLCGVFRSHADHHAQEQERYQRILADESEDAEEA